MNNVQLNSFLIRFTPISYIIESKKVTNMYSLLRLKSEIEKKTFLINEQRSSILKK